MRERTMGRLLDEAVAAHPENEALVYIDREFRMTYREFGGLVDGLARGLVALGVRPGEKVAVWAANVPYWIALQFASAKIGAIFVTVNTGYRKAELENLLRHSEAENIFITDGFGDVDYVRTLYDLVPELKERQRGDIKSAAFPRLRRVMFLGQEKHRGMYTMPEIMGMGRMVQDQEYADRQNNVKGKDTANIQFTAGTTGLPKGVMLSHRAVVSNGRNVGANQQFTHQDRICLPVPLFNTFGCVLGVLAAVAHAATLVVLESFDPVQVMASVDEEKCTALYGVPSMFASVLDHKLFKRFDFSSLRTGVIAGSHCPAPLLRRIVDEMPIPGITQCYGLTEAASAVAQTLPDDPDEVVDLAAGLPLPGVEVRVCDSDGCSIKPGAYGEVRVKGSCVMQGYYKDPEGTAKVLDEDGWLKTGDLGILGKEGRLVITGRRKDLIIRSGEHVVPGAVEDYLATMEGVAEVQVVGVPSKAKGEEVAAFIVPAQGFELTVEDVRDFCRGNIAAYKVPRHIFFVEDFPRGAGGDVMKYQLRKLANGMFLGG